MVADEDLLIADMAETYHVLNYRELPIRTLVALFSGLRDDSRIKMKYGKSKTDFKTLLLAGILDRLSMLVWINSKKGTAKPKMLTDELLENDSELMSFDSAEDFEKIKTQIMKGDQNGD